MSIVGYSTGTFDGCHEGQLRFLRNCRSLLPSDGKLIIGLTTDELAVKQKRAPLHSYEHRRAMLLGLRGLVDDVVPHSGDDKKTALKKLGFTHCFIGDEYYGSDEYRQIEDLVTVRYVPRHPYDALSSSKDAIRQCYENARKVSILAQGGPGGPIYVYADKPESVVIKTIRISLREFEGVSPRWTGPMSTANVYDLPIPNPRNFKRLGEVHRYPNIPGVNSYREIAVQALIRRFAWCTTLNVCLIHSDPGVVDAYPASDDWNHLNLDKQIPRETYFIYQRHAGVRLSDWISGAVSRPGFVAELQSIVDRVKGICSADLRESGLVHGDLHEGNICVQERSARDGPAAVGVDSNETVVDIALIDWGWCLHRSFEMNDAEREYYEQCLESGWDWRHFRDAMEYAYHSEPWFPSVSF